MPKQILRLFCLMFSGMIATGCASVKARTYMEDKERVDQEVTGNAGFLRGEAAPGQDRVPVKTTRKVYVFEVTKENPSEDAALDELYSGSKKTEKSSQNFTSKDDIAVKSSSSKQSSGKQSSSPDLDSSDADSAKQIDPLKSLSTPSSSSSPAWSPVPLPTQYTVNKDDTMQSISKKFYNSYTKWPRIYEVNKDKISDPNRIKPGLVLTIPAI